MGKVIKIREVGDPILLQICEEVDTKFINQEVLDTIDDLKETLNYGTGLGISIAVLEAPAAKPKIVE